MHDNETSKVDDTGLQWLCKRLRKAPRGRTKPRHSERNGLVPNANQERDEKGHFIAGNKANRRALPAEVELKYRKIIMRECTPEDWAQISRKAIEQAKDGNRYARDWLTNYLIGKPIQTVRQVIDKRSVTANLLGNLSTERLAELRAIVIGPGNADSDRVGVVKARLEEVHTRSLEDSRTNDKVH